MDEVPFTVTARDQRCRNIVDPRVEVVENRVVRRTLPHVRPDEVLQQGHHHRGVLLRPSLPRGVRRHQERQHEVHTVLVLTYGAGPREPAGVVRRPVSPESRERIEGERMGRVPGVVHPVASSGLLPYDRAQPLVGVTHVDDADVLSPVVAVAHVHVHEERLAAAGCSEHAGVVVRDELPLQRGHLCVHRHRDVAQPVHQTDRPLPESPVEGLPGAQAQRREQLHRDVVLHSQLRLCPRDGGVPHQRGVELVAHRPDLHRGEGGRYQRAQFVLTAGAVPSYQRHAAADGEQPQAVHVVDVLPNLCGVHTVVRRGDTAGHPRLARLEVTQDLVLRRDDDVVVDDVLARQEDADGRGVRQEQPRGPLRRHASLGGGAHLRRQAAALGYREGDGPVVPVLDVVAPLFVVRHQGRAVPEGGYQLYEPDGVPVALQVGRAERLRLHAAAFEGRGDELAGDGGELRHPPPVRHVRADAEAEVAAVPAPPGEG